MDAIKQFLAYDPLTGVFTCIRRYCDKIAVGTEVGSMANGYRCLTFRGQTHYSHRLAWWWVHGVWPTEVDHKNTVRTDNRLSNLRLATRSRNVANAGRRKQRGFKGVYWVERLGRWIAKIKVNYRHMHLGVYSDEKQAALAYDIAAHQHFGEFASLNFARTH